MKSMLSAKSFRPSINSVDQAEKWLRIFAADLYNRLVVDGLLEHKRRPKTITLHHRTGSQVHSKRLPIFSGETIDEDTLFDLAKTLLGQVILEGRAWPSLNLSLSVGDFEDGVVGNRAIDSFLVRGQAAISMGSGNTPRETVETSEDQERAGKRRKVEDSGIQRFFRKNLKVERDSEEKNTAHNASPTLVSDHGSSEQTLDQDPHLEIQNESEGGEALPFVDSVTCYRCTRCNKVIPEPQQDEHDDWHFAKDLETQERQPNRTTQEMAQRRAMRASADHKKPGSVRRSGKPEKGQTRLAFA
jgi:DNA polymerase eta